MNPELKTILEAFYFVLRENYMGIRSEDVCKAISIKLGKEFNFRKYGCQTLYEFLKKFVIPEMELEIIS